MNTIGIRQLRKDMGDTLARVTAGESITLTDYKHPVARLVPVAHNDRYCVAMTDSVPFLYCVPCGAIIGPALRPVSDLLTTIGEHDTTQHAEDAQ